MVRKNLADSAAIATATATATPLATSTATPTAIATPSAADKFKLEKINLLKSKQTDFSTFSGRAHAKLNIDGNQNDVTMNIRIKKDQQIWISVTAILGIEVARALITPDSIKVLNRLQGNYLKKPFSYIYQYTSHQVNYKTIESIVLGNAVPALLNENDAVQANGGNILVSGQLQDLLYQLTFSQDSRVVKTNMSNQSAGQTVQVDNSNFVATSNRVIPAQININSSVKEKVFQINLNYQKADFDQTVEFPFAVPSRYPLVN